MNEIKFKSLKIQNLFGYKNIQLKFKDQFLVFVGENGSGKTTILNSFFYTLTRNFEKLNTIPFGKITLSYDDKIISFEHYEVDAYVRHEQAGSIKEQGLFKYISGVITQSNYKTYLKVIISDIADEEKYSIVNNMLINSGFKIKASPRYLYTKVKHVIDEFISIDLEQRIQPLSDFDEIPIFYFPTYRRVESKIECSEDSEDFDDVLLDHDDLYDEQSQNISRLENLNFGMSDVEDMISDLLFRINSITMQGFRQILVDLLGEMANPQETTPRNVDDATIKIILDRLSSQIKEEDKSAIQNYALDGGTKNNHMNFLINKLIDLYNSQKDLDDTIKNFKDTCNKYFFEKLFVYDESAIKLQIMTTNGDVLKLDNLSSGEKQIVALFAKLYLSRVHNAIVLIDEPELSLSIEWQRKILPDIIASNCCSLLVAVTHSPFIFDNDMQQYTCGINDLMQ